MYKAVVFDMDGVIFDSEKVYRIMERNEALKYGLDESKIETFCEAAAGGTKEVNKINFETIFETDIDYYQYREGVMSSVDEFANTQGYELKKGVVELLDLLKEKNIKIALATSTQKDRAVKHLKAHNLYDYFDGFVFGDMIKNGKPAPDIYLKACEIVGVKPEESVGVEDSINGILSSHSAGLYTVMVIDLIQPNEKIDGKADLICNDLTEMMHLF
ncbi:MAG: HAD family phosphatase [Lachnospiraceae bacterium]|nr:HAD family phosphatase [Lachnospiraceae bacterium]